MRRLWGLAAALALASRAAGSDKGWWRDLVNHIFDDVTPSISELDRDNFFEIAYEHFAEAGVWQLFPEV